MSETAASKQPFDPQKFCECPNCFSVHRRGSIPAELKPAAMIGSDLDCKYCHGSGFVDHYEGDVRVGVKKCTHTAPQGDMPF